jgi:hypothetical protein
MNRKHSTLNDRNNIKRTDYLNNLYRNIFSVMVTNKDVKSMKRFMRRKFENDNLFKKVKADPKYSDKLIKTNAHSSIKYKRYLNDISTLVCEPRFIDTPMSGEMSCKTRAYVNRPISARRNKDKLKINKISYNTEIVIIEEFIEQTLDSNSFSNDSFDDKSEDKFTLYIESQIDSISDNDSEVGNKKKDCRNLS